MTKHNAENERSKRKCLAYLKEAKRHSELTVDAAAKARNRFGAYTRYRDFSAFYFEQKVAQKASASGHFYNARSSERLAVLMRTWINCSDRFVRAGVWGLNSSQSIT